MKSFENRIALVTGAANGLGRALSIEIAKLGGQLFLTDIDHKGLEKTAEEASHYQQKIIIQTTDISQYAEVVELAGQFSGQFDKLDLLVNNAAVSILARLEEMEMEDFYWLAGVNYFGPVHCVKAFLPFLKNSVDAQILNIGSGAGLQGFSRRSAYCSSKFALRGFSESMHAELFPLGIKVRTAFPGPLSTEIYTRSRYSNDKDRKIEGSYLSSKGMTAEIAAQTILRKLSGNKEEIIFTKEIRMLYFLKRYFPWIFPKYLSRNQDKLPI